MCSFSCASDSARGQDAEHIVLTHDDVIGSVHFGLGPGIFSEQDTVACFDVEGHQRAVLESLAVARSYDFAFLRFLLGGSGMMMPWRVVSFSSMRFTTMRSYRGRMFMML